LHVRQAGLATMAWGGRRVRKDQGNAAGKWRVPSGQPCSTWR
jgi:hypothetical protein